MTFDLLLSHHAHKEKRERLISVVELTPENDITPHEAFAEDGERPCDGGCGGSGAHGF